VAHSRYARRQPRLPARYSARRRNAERIHGRLRPTIYRGHLFPDDYYGNAFVAEPAAHLVKRNYVSEHADGSVRASLAYEGREFLASTDERFRPVDLATGPDGALYVVDLYRGILQHRISLTTYLRRQILEK